jgi:hypothetical protein
MRKHLVIITILLLSAYVLSGCILDPKETPPPPGGGTTVWPDLKERDDVFEYLDLVYENMDKERFPKLLDDGFIFVFSQADYNAGITPEQWGREEELSSARNMFSNVSHERYGAITGIELEITPEGLWIELPKTEPPYEGETWYQKTAEYRIIAETTSEYTLQGTERKALFTVRLAEVDGEDIYRIVQWNDDIE